MAQSGPCPIRGCRHPAPDTRHPGPFPQPLTPDPYLLLSSTSAIDCSNTSIGSGRESDRSALAASE